MQWCTVSISVYLHVLNICNISQRLTWASEQHVPVMFICAFNIILLANVQQEQWGIDPKNGDVNSCITYKIFAFVLKKKIIHTLKILPARLKFLVCGHVAEMASFTLDIWSCLNLFGGKRTVSSKTPTSTSVQAQIYVYNSTDIHVRATSLNLKFFICVNQMHICLYCTVSPYVFVRKLFLLHYRTQSGKPVVYLVESKVFLPGINSVTGM